jgi:hypothetical protein
MAAEGLAFEHQRFRSEGPDPARDYASYRASEAALAVQHHEPISAAQTAAREAADTLTWLADPTGGNDIDSIQGWHARQQLESAAVACLLRCVVGNPFRPISPGPWITPASFTVAQDAYDRRDFAALPMLADLLEEAGCPEQSLFDHCRQPGEHARGCWVVDLVLGKS